MFSSLTFNLTPLMAAIDPIGHITDKPLIKGRLFGMEVWWLSNVTIMLALGAVVTLLIVIPAARRIVTGSGQTIDDFRAKGMWANMVEAVCVQLREDVFRPSLGAETDRFAPILWTFFWFIFVSNLLGLLPLLDASYAVVGMIVGEQTIHAWKFHGIGGTATQSIWVTGALALTSFVFYNTTAFVRSPLGYCKHLTAGAPWFMWPVMVPVEIIGTFVKPFALCLRLFANMTGGHIIIAVLLAFVGGMIQAMGPAGYAMALLPLLGAVAINLLEIMVALIQAFVFTLLTCLFLSQLVVHEHEHEEHDAASHPANDEHGVAVKAG